MFFSPKHVGDVPAGFSEKGIFPRKTTPLELGKWPM